MNFAPFGKKSQHFDAGESLIIKGSGYCSVSNVEKETNNEIGIIGLYRKSFQVENVKLAKR